MQKTNEIILETGNIKIASNHSNIITRALGSCVALTLYDQVQKIGGMIHYILPENPGGKKKEKYADTGINFLFAKILESNAKRENLVAKMIGGAVMFEDFIDDIENSIGNRNVIKGKEILKNLEVKLLSEDTGGNYGRSVKFQLTDGKIYITSYKTGVKII
jgi:chemotaxis protein CheD